MIILKLPMWLNGLILDSPGFVLKIVAQKGNTDYVILLQN
jgi:hypothetical protein